MKIMYRVVDKQNTAYAIRYMGRFLAVGLVLLLLIKTLYAPVVYAANTQQATFSIEQIIVNNSSSALPIAAFTYLLAPRTANAPMPSGSGSQDYTFALIETGEILLRINFDAPGIFTYELSCITDDIPGFTIDRRVHIIEVHVTIDLQVTIIVFITSGTKVPSISFTHVYNDNGFPGDPEKPKDPKGPEEPGNPNKPEVIINPPAVAIPGGTTPPKTLPKEPESPNDLEVPIESEVLIESEVPNEPEVPIEPSIPQTPDTTDEPDTPSQPGNPGTSPRTGDFSNPTLWITLIAISSVLLLFLAFIRWKSKER